MTGYAEAVQGIFGLIIGGFLFLVFASAMPESMSSGSFLNLEVMGILYFIGAIVLAVGVVYTVVENILN